MGVIKILEMVDIRKNERQAFTVGLRILDSGEDLLIETFSVGDTRKAICQRIPAGIIQCLAEFGNSVGRLAHPAVQFPGPGIH